jgi:nucleoside 2-deoxyribosyltransferase
MRGYSEYNFPAFYAAAKRLREQGHEVWSPAENDVDQDGFNPKTDQPKTMSHYMARDLPQVCASDAVAMLNGWQDSEGARLEALVARKLGKPVLSAETLKPETVLPLGVYTADETNRMSCS